MESNVISSPLNSGNIQFESVKMLHKNLILGYQSLGWSEDANCTRKGGLSGLTDYSACYYCYYERAKKAFLTTDLLWKMSRKDGF